MNGLLTFNFSQSLKDNGLTFTEKASLKLLKQASGEIIEYDGEMSDYFNNFVEEFIQKSNYILTEDNINKMIAIVKRFECDLPVVIR
jgi:hypothetical protein